jgi:phosphoglycolate phosphatase-like HAD superfamily hydrolase
MARARPTEQEDLLAAVVSRVLGTQRALAVLDLDSTVLDNRPRQARILRDYAEEAGVEALRDARPEHWQGWELSVALRNAGLGDAELRAHLAPARRFWQERFFTSRYCRHDVPIAGAPEYVRALAAAGARVAYVTGRPPAMREGTLGSLARHGFPVPDGERARLLLKEDPAMGDDAW